jgi:hypothetical protein
MPTNYKKLKIREVLKSDINIGKRYLTDVVEELTKYLKEYSERGYMDVYIEQDYYSYEKETTIIGYREESNDEYLNRIKQAEKAEKKRKDEQKKKEDTERALYLKLKKKYDKGS